MCVVSTVAATGAAAAAGPAAATAVNWGAVSMMASLAAAGLSTYSSMKQGQAANAAAEANAQVMENNAQMAELEAASIEEAGRKKKSQHWLKVKDLIGSQRSALAGGNLAVDQGTALTVQEQSAALGEADAQTLDRNIQLDAWAKRAEGSNYQGQASAARAGKSSPLLPAAGTLLSGAGKVAGQWYEYNK